MDIRELLLKQLETEKFLKEKIKEFFGQNSPTRSSYISKNITEPNVNEVFEILGNLLEGTFFSQKLTKKEVYPKIFFTKHFVAGYEGQEALYKKIGISSSGFILQPVSRTWVGDEQNKLGDVISNARLAIRDPGLYFKFLLNFFVYEKEGIGKWLEEISPKKIAPWYNEIQPEVEELLLYISKYILRHYIGHSINIPFLPNFSALKPVEKDVILNLNTDFLDKHFAYSKKLLSVDILTKEESFSSAPMYLKEINIKEVFPSFDMIDKIKQYQFLLFIESCDRMAEDCITLDFPGKPFKRDFEKMVSNSLLERLFTELSFQVVQVEEEGPENFVQEVATKIENSPGLKKLSVLNSL